MDSDLVRLAPHYSAGYVVLAYVVAVLGSWSSIELLLRRTGMTGAYNALLLFAGGIAFGSTATWGMHFIGNQSLSLRDPTSTSREVIGMPALQLSYSPGFTILSLLVSCIVSILAFSFIGLRWTNVRSRLQKVTALGARDDGLEKGSNELDGAKDDGVRSVFSKNDTSIYSRDVSEDDESSIDEGEFGLHPRKISAGGVAKIVVAGVICGAGIAAMHYIGQFSITGIAKIDNEWYTVVLSILIACFAVTIGLWILFVLLRPKLQHSWYKRLGVAMILGGATTLMHFVALLGTHYCIVRGTYDRVLMQRSSSRTLILVLVGILTPLCCISLLAFAVLAQQRIVRRNVARQRTILAVALFDNAGNILVQPEDRLLPSAQILVGAESNKFTFADILEAFGIRRRLSTTAAQRKLSRKDPAFLAFLKTSWKWRMPGAEIMPIDNDPTFMSPDILRSVQAFEHASSEIAQRLSGRPDLLVRNGVLHDDVLKTGHFPVTSPTGETLTVTQGHLLVCSRRVTNIAERDAFLSKGYLFVEPAVISRAVGFALAVPEERMFSFLRDVYNSSRAISGRTVEAGRLYGGVLILQATAGDGLRIIVDDKQHTLLPMVELATLQHHSQDRRAIAVEGLPPARLDSILPAVQALAGQSLATLVHEDGMFAEGRPVSDFDVSNVRSWLVSSIPQLLSHVTSDAAAVALASRLTIAPKLIPLFDSSEDSASRSYLICFKACVPASLTLPGRSPRWYPFSLFKVQTDCQARVQAMKRPDTLAASRSLRSSISGPSSHLPSHESLAPFDPYWVTQLVRDTTTDPSAWHWVEEYSQGTRAAAQQQSQKSRQ